MAFQHRTHEIDEQTLDVLTDEEAGLRIVVARLGAELVSIARHNADGEWIGFLHRDGEITKPETGWGNHATVMGYFLHRVKDGQTLYNGQEIRGGTHSFLRHKHFAAPEVTDEGALIYRLAASEITPHEYPYAVSFQLTYELVGGTLRVSFTFHNEEATPVQISFGLHPGFGVTTLADAELKLPAGRYERFLAPDNFLSGETQILDFAGGEMPFAKAELPGSFILGLAGVDLPIFVLADPATRRVTYLNYSGAPYVTLWSDGGPFLCVEPCWGLPDAHEQLPFERKLGNEEVPPLGHLTRSITIAPQFL